MKKAKFLSIHLCLAMLIGLFAGCGTASDSSSITESSEPDAAAESSANASPEQSGAKKFKIGFTVYGMDDAFTTYVVDGANKFAEEHKDEVDLQIGDSKKDSATQLSLVENWCSQEFDAIIIYVVDSTMGPTLIDVCQKANIPIIGCNRAFEGMEDGCVAYVGSDELQAGHLQAQYIADLLGGKGNVGVLMGELGLDNTAKRTQGYHDIFDKYPDIKVVQENTAKWDTAEAMKVTENWLQMDLDLAAIVANNDQMAIGASNALVAENTKDKVLVSGIDAIPPALEAIKAGTLDATTYQPGLMQGYTSVEIALKACKGEGPTTFESTWIDFELVTAENVDQYLELYK